jgi:glycosyltransferase involved in cell wall biosynthesis
MNDNTETIILLFVGRFDYQKGIDILLKLFTTRAFPNIELILIGDNVLNKDKFNIPPSVQHLGWLESAEIEKYYKLCDAVIIPSRWEGFGLVALEAMKNKKAVIASNVAALPEIVVNEVTGILFEIDKPDELYSILLSLDKKKLSQMGEKGYKRYKENFTADIMNFNILESYKQLLKN